MDKLSNHPYQVMSNDLQAMQSPSAPPPAYDQQPGPTPRPQHYANNNEAGVMVPPPGAVGAPPSILTINTAAGGAYPPMIGNPSVGPRSTELNCPQCRCRIKTRVNHRSTSKTHIACLLLSWTLCCCCLPYCMDSCRNANHFCPMCGAFIGTYQS